MGFTWHFMYVALYIEWKNIAFPADVQFSKCHEEYNTRRETRQRETRKAYVIVSLQHTLIMLIGTETLCQIYLL